MYRVIYIVGSGRSGSTILDTILGNHPKVESVGELTNLPTAGWRNNEYCACGARVSACDYWCSVRRYWESSVDNTDLDHLIKLQNRFENYKSWPRLAIEAKKPSKAFLEYGQHMGAIFNGVREVTGKSIVVDSSKKPARAIALSLIADIDLRLVHLVRDGRGVSWSLMKAYRKNEAAGFQRDLPSRPSSRTALMWMLSNLGAERASQNPSISKHVMVRYEDFVNDTKASLNSIGSTCEVSLESLAKRVKENSSFDVGHNIAGNHLRMGGKIILGADTEWTKKLPLKDRKKFEHLAKWMLKRYDYD